MNSAPVNGSTVLWSTSNGSRVSRNQHVVAAITMIFVCNGLLASVHTLGAASSFSGIGFWSFAALGAFLYGAYVFGYQYGRPFTALATVILTLATTFHIFLVFPELWGARTIPYVCVYGIAAAVVLYDVRLTGGRRGAETADIVDLPVHGSASSRRAA